MVEPRPGPLAEHIHHVVTDRELDDTWRRLDASLRPERRAPRWLPLGGLAGAAVVVMLTVTLWPRTKVDGTRLEAGATIATGSSSLQGVLEEGSVVQAAPASAGALEFASASEVRVRLDRGEFRFDVAKKPTRRFSVVAGHVEVRVVGTTFTVRREATASVQVERGVVEVWVNGSQRAVLTAGQRWDEAPLAAVPAIVPEPVEPPAAPEAPATQPEPKPTKRIAPVKRAVKPVAAGHTASPEPQPLPPPVSSATPTLPDDPSTLFKVALDARRAGRASEAAQALRHFVAQFPDDSRSGLALFELGRLEMDQLRSPTRAIESLEQAVSKAPSGSFVEDAMARLARLHHDLRHVDACRAAKASYLRRFPSGVHAATLEPLCPF
ncbi:MAG: FecR domain-containing protein [Myxococcaceae bacterium]|nr:FecR domain-containing protein [Myxococcaceae bacterium]